MNSDHPQKILSPRYISRVDFIRQRCRQRRVLHLGCSSGRYIKDRLLRGSLLHGIIVEEAAVAYGLDIDEASLVTMERLGFDHLLVGNAENLDEVKVDAPFDVVVAGDLLEHLTCPGAMLEGVKRLLAPGGVFLVSTVNAFGLHFQIKRWLGRHVEHPEHVCYYSPETLEHLFERHRYRVLEMYGAYTEPPHSFRRKVEFFFGLPLFSIAPVLAGTLVVVAQPH